MAIEIKNGAGTPTLFKITPKTGEIKTEFALTLSEIKPIERRAVERIERTDSVVITNPMLQITQNVGSSSAESSVDFDRVARIKAAIENGTYEINPDRIAAKMMQFDIL